MKNPYSDRKYIIIGVIILVGIIYLSKLFYLQVVNKSYLISAQSNVLRVIYQFPARGLIFDRNQRLMVFNEAAYDLMVIPGQVKEFDTLELCRLVGIEKDDLIRKVEKAKKYSLRKASVFEKQLSIETYAFLEEKLYQFPGFFVQSRTLRKYSEHIAAHTLGYVGEVGKSIIEADSYYRSGDYTGISGLENTYEKYLRGRKGVKHILVDVFNREKGSFMDGKYDTVALKGDDIEISIDASLQAYGEQLMKNKKGSIVAIEPASGEILAMVTSPSYDPGMLVGRIRSNNYKRLQQDTLEPLFNRALTATYPPGSTFKLMNALIALHEGVVTTRIEYTCNGPESLPIKCSHYHTSPLNLIEAIEISCNPFFWNVFQRIMQKDTDIHNSFSIWKSHVESFGFGQKFSSDLYTQSTGFIPDPGYFDYYYGKTGWRPMTIRSLSIGQGEILVTPLQLANFAATMANRGFYRPPHLIRSIEGKRVDSYDEKIGTSIDPAYFDPVIEGMFHVFEGEEGTARWYKLDSITICGKTGTAENPHGEDHSIFIAFAPKDNPVIALSVVVENSGFGTTWAVPITTLLIEKYLTGTISKPWVEERMLNGNLISGN